MQFHFFYTSNSVLLVVLHYEEHVWFVWCDCYTVEHRRGVAGGGWEDEDAAHDTAVNVHAAEHSVLSSSTAADTDCDRWRTSVCLRSCSSSSVTLWLSFCWYILRRGGATGKAFGLAISRSRVQILLEATLRNNLRQVVYTYVPLSPSSITWYRPKGGDALWLER